MTEQEQAAEHLKVIRSLMERATVYRAISWPAALFGGVLAVGLAAWLYARTQIAITADGQAGPLISSSSWVLAWLLAMVVTGAFNTLLIARMASREGRPLCSPGLKLAVRAIAPAMAAGGLLGIGHILWSGSSVAGGAAIWVVCYGLALLATRGFAPKSMPRLGWALLVAGMVAYALTGISGHQPAALADAGNDMLRANLIMGICFGFFHLVYGFIVMQTNRRGTPEAGGDAA